MSIPTSTVKVGMERTWNSLNVFLSSIKQDKKLSTNDAPAWPSAAVARMNWRGQPEIEKGFRLIFLQHLTSTWDEPGTSFEYADRFEMSIAQYKVPLGNAHLKKAFNSRSTS